MSILQQAYVHFKRGLLALSIGQMISLPQLQAAEKVSQQERLTRQMLQEWGLNKAGSQNLSNRQLLGNVITGLQKRGLPVPPDLFKIQKLYGDEKFPKVEANRFKAKNGEENIRLVMTYSNGRTMTMELIGEKDQFLKVNNVVYSYYDVSDIHRFMQKAVDKDEFFRKAATEEYNKRIQQKFFVPTVAQWKSMKVDQKANYILIMQQALEVTEKARNLGLVRQGASVDKGILNHYLENLFGDEAWAQSKSSKSKSDKTSKVSRSNSKPVDANKIGTTAPDPESETTCVNAGWVVRLSKDGKTCKIPSNYKYQLSEEGDYKFKTEIQKCDKGGIPCNPLLFGVNKTGSPFCVPSDKQNRDYATTQNGYCRAVSNKAYGLCEGAKDCSASSARDGASTDAKLAFFKSILNNDAAFSGAKVNKDGKVQAASDENANILNALFQRYAGEIERVKTSACGVTSGSKEGLRQQDICATIAELNMQIEAIGPEKTPEPPAAQNPPTETPPQCLGGDGKPNSGVTGQCQCSAGGGSTVVSNPGACVPANPPTSSNPPQTGGAGGGDQGGGDTASEVNRSSPQATTERSNNGFCKTSSGTNWCAAVGMVSLIAAFAALAFHGKNSKNGGIDNTPPLCPPGGLCGANPNTPSDPVTPTLPKPPPVAPPSEGGTSLPVAPAGAR